MDRLAAMETFVRVVDAGSFSSAAKQLRIGQPGVSKSVAQLEDRLGVRLLLRSTRGLTPTEVGRKFYDRAKRSIEEADEAEHAARGAATALSGRLRICVTSTFARLHVVHRLPAFLAQHPALDVDVVLPDGDIDLIEAGIDVALRIGPLRDSVLTARKIAHLSTSSAGCCARNAGKRCTTRRRANVDVTQMRKRPDRVVAAPRAACSASSASSIERLARS
jgi:DNA-binding transcriptional LysR family regulator